MREALVTMFKEKFNIDMFQSMTPEQTAYPVGCFAIAEENIDKELDGSGLSVNEVVFDVDIVCNDTNEVDLYRSMLLELSGKSRHRWRNLFQVMFVRSVEDVGPMLGVTTDSGQTPQIIALRLSFFK